MAHPTDIANTSDNDDFWIFGYGSPYEMKTAEYPATSKAMFVGFGKLALEARQLNHFDSEDHRGTPSHPGRVVTLISSSHYSSLLPSISGSSPPPEQRVWGAVYHIPTPHVPAVQSYLDIREINGYSIQYTTFTPSDPSLTTMEKMMVYIGLPSNPQFLGPQDPDALARRILGCRGPSGENREYLFMLREALRALGEGAGDEHVEDLAKKVEALGQREREEGGKEVGKKAVEGEIERVRVGESNEAVEETEKS
ncbi:MAG: hypothetical protein Q9201_006546 [Fulgogasparrea decipioides]